MTPKKRIRKPEPWTLDGKLIADITEHDSIRINTAYYLWYPKEARRLAAWLEKAASWLEQKEKMK